MCHTGSSGAKQSERSKGAIPARGRFRKQPMAGYGAEYAVAAILRAWEGRLWLLPHSGVHTRRPLPRKRHWPERTPAHRIPSIPEKTRLQALEAQPCPTKGQKGQANDVSSRRKIGVRAPFVHSQSGFIANRVAAASRRHPPILQRLPPEYEIRPVSSWRLVRHFRHGKHIAQAADCRDTDRA